MPVITMNINYHQNTTNYIVGIPSLVEISGYRKRTTTINNQGKLLTVKDYINQNNYLTTSMQYDKYGNCTKITYPNHSYEYLYDSEIHTYPVRVTDVFGHYSRMEDYDYRFGIPLSVYDKSGNKMEYTLDKWGRISTIRGPKEIASGAEYTIKYKYQQANIWNGYFIEPAQSYTYHINSSYPGDVICVYTYVDGLGRVIQTKKDVEINGKEMMVVSGWSYYDAFGRVVKSYYPTTEKKENKENKGYSVGNGDVPPSTTTYDILDRPLLQKAPDNTVTQYSYDFGTDDRGNNLFLTKIIDPRGKTSQILKNIDELQYGMQAAGQQWVYFDYNLIGECMQVYGLNDFSRNYTYDWLGRKTQYEEDSLKETYTYTGENLTQKKMYWNENGTTQQKTITYTYTNNRIKKMKSSEYNTDIQYDYNNTGRLDIISDENGMETYEYGNMGEITKMTRKYLLPFMDTTIAITTLFEYDSWGRINKLTYPDEEEVKYEYDYGGLLRRMTGSKNGHNYTYIDNIHYDKFGAKTEEGVGGKC